MAGATATYRIGPSDFFTPGDLKSDADTLDGQVSDLDQQIEGNESIETTASDQWTAWIARWKAFYGSNFGGFFTNLFTSLNDANRDQLIQFEKEFANLATSFATQGAQLAAGVVQPSTGSGDTIGAQASQQVKDLPTGVLPSTTSIIIILGLIVVALFIFKEG